MSPSTDKESINLPSSFSSYTPPQHGLLSYLPSSWVPYAELIRLTRPIGIVIIHCPFLFGTLFAVATSQYPLSLYELLKLEAILLLSTVFLRGCMVAFNDLADRKIDGKIARTQHRPMARGAISPFAGYIFVLAQALIWLAILAQLSPTCVYYAIPALGFAAFYPYAKRVTDLTPVVLGFTMALGVFIGCAATDTSPVSTRTTTAALLTLYLSCAVWTVIYETIYAHQDIIDDEKQGVKSLAIRLKGRAKAVLSALAILQTTLLACTGWLMEADFLHFAGSCVGVGLSLGVMIWKVDLKQPAQCWWWFAKGTWLVGGNIIAGFVVQIGGSR